MKYIIFLFSAFFLVGCQKGSEPENEPKAEIIRNVKYITTSRTSYIIERELSGVVQSTRTSPLSFKVVAQLMMY